MTRAQAHPLVPLFAFHCAAISRTPLLRASWRMRSSSSIVTFTVDQSRPQVDATLRDGTAAVEIMEEIVLKRQIIDIELLNTLAAAYAEAGQFEDAVQVSQQAMEVVKQTNNARMIAEIERRIVLYQSSQPLRWTIPPRAD